MGEEPLWLLSSERFIYFRYLNAFMWKDRKEAGQKLAVELKKYKGKKEVLVLGIPRGGVETAFEIARELGAELGVVVTKKIPFPGQEELAIGAVDGDGEVVLDETLIVEQGIGNEYIEKEKERIVKEIKRRYKEFGEPEIKGKIAIVVDDGIATGQTMKAALKFVKRKRPKRLVLAVPVAAKEILDGLGKDADEVVCLWKAEMMFAVGQFYDNFPQTSDEEVKVLLGKIKG